MEASLRVVAFYIVLTGMLSNCEDVIPTRTKSLQQEDTTSSPPPYRLNELLPADRTTLIDLPDFHFIINNFPCNTTHLLLLIVVIKSATGNVEKRSAIRSTYAQVSDDRYKVLFLLGEVKTAEEQKLLVDENLQHHDLVQGSFLDVYRNLTYKSTMGLKWTTYFCQNARYILSVDDDIYVNMPRLLEYISLKLPPFNSSEGLIFCTVNAHFSPERYMHKWQVTYEEYPGDAYPNYCRGFVTLYSPDVVFLLYREVQLSKYFWIEDIHISGVMAAKLKLNHTSLDDLILPEKNVKDLLNGKNIDANFLFTYDNMAPNAMRMLYNNTNRTTKSPPRLAKPKHRLNAKLPKKVYGRGDGTIGYGRVQHYNTPDVNIIYLGCVFVLIQYQVVNNFLLL